MTRAAALLLLLALGQDPAEPELKRRLDEAAALFKLGLRRRGLAVLDALVAAHPGAKERAAAAVPPPVPRRERITGPVAREVDEWFDKGTPIRPSAPLADYLDAIRRGRAVSDRSATGLLERRTLEGVPYLLRVPKAYDPALPMRLLITLHGSGGSAAAALAAWGKSLDAEDDLVVAAPEGGNPGWGNSRAGHERVLSVLREVQRDYAIDPDRVFLDGASMGAHGAFFLAMHHPDRWAAIAPRAGSARFINFHPVSGVPDLSPAPALLDNLWRTPVFLVAGTKDPNSPIVDLRMTRRRLEVLGPPLVYREHPDGGHEWFPDEDPDVLDFFRHHVRRPYPNRVKLAAREKEFARSYWVELLESTRDPRIEVQHIGMDRKPIETRREYDKPVEILAEADRAKNRITVHCSGAKSLRLWLADEIVDLDRPLSVWVNGAKAYEGKLERSLDLALEECRRRGDRGMPFTAKIDVRVN